VVAWDTEPPQPAISAAEGYSSTDQRRIPLLIDFGERVLQLNPLRLFETSGLGRVDVIYEVLEGRLYLVGSVATPNNVTHITSERMGGWQVAGGLLWATAGSARGAGCLRGQERRGLRPLLARQTFAQVAACCCAVRACMSPGAPSPAGWLHRGCSYCAGRGHHRHHGQPQPR
jgi:hypothetical protein